MKELIRALGPVRRRIRLGRGLRGGCLGLLAGAALCLALNAAAFLLPLPGRARLLPPLFLLPAGAGALACALWPVGPGRAARAADAAGLMERAQTALSLQEDSPMARLQRADALRALRELNPRQVPLPQLGRWLAAAAATAALAALLLALPNPQTAAVQRIEDFQRRMEQAEEQLQQAAEKAADPLSPSEREELRRLLDELRRETGRARDPLDALLALDAGEKRLEQLQDAWAAQNLAALSQALAQAGLNAPAAALEAGEQEALTQALSGLDASALEQAGEGQAQPVQAALSAAAQALAQGQTAQAAQALSGAQAASGQQQSALENARQALDALRSALQGGQSAMRASGQSDQAGQAGQSGQNGQSSQAGQAGQSGQNGQSSQNGQNGQSGQSGAEGPAQGQPGGAGQGASNQAQGSALGDQQGGRGSRDPRYQEKQFEEIYDPTRLSAGETALSAAGQKGEGESTQMQLGPGAGSTEGYVPYNRVLGEYAEAAAQAADSQALSAQAKKWVDDYFAALTNP